MRISLLEHRLKTLKLPAMLREYAKAATRCARENVDHPVYLMHLTEQELIGLKRRAAERRLKPAKFPSINTLDSFDFTDQPSINKTQVVELMRCIYLDHCEKILLVSIPGTGKTQLTTALGVEPVAPPKKARFCRVTELISRSMEARDERTLTRINAQMAKLDLLILDELGYVPTGKLRAELLFDDISLAYERTSVIVTTNLPSERCVDVLGSERLTGAALDRLTHRCHVLEAIG